MVPTLVIKFYWDARGKKWELLATRNGTHVLGRTTVDRPVSLDGDAARLLAEICAMEMRSWLF